MEAVSGISVRHQRRVSASGTVPSPHHVRPSERGARVEDSIRLALLAQDKPMEWLLENRCLQLPHRFLDSAFGLASNDIRRPLDPRRAEPAGSLSVSLSVSLSNGRIGTAYIDSDSDSDSDSDQTPLPLTSSVSPEVSRVAC